MTCLCKSQRRMPGIVNNYSCRALVKRIMITVSKMESIASQISLIQNTKKQINMKMTTVMTLLKYALMPHQKMEKTKSSASRISLDATNRYLRKPQSKKRQRCKKLPRKISISYRITWIQLTIARLNNTFPKFR